jgi:multidrug efflux system membrane fusion protein
MKPFARLTRGLPTLALAVLLSTAPACSPGAAKAGRQASAVPVLVGKVERRTLARTHLSVGTVRSISSVAIKPQVDGVIQRIHVADGSEVSAGQLLISIDRRPFENALQIARADLANAKAEKEKADADAVRYAQLRSSQGVSDELLAQYFTKRDTTTATLLSKQASVANAELMLGYTEIRAPFSGRAGQMNLREGSLVKANDSGSQLITINQISPIEVAYTIPEQFLPDLRAAAKAGPVRVLVSSTGSDATSEGSLSFIDNTVDSTTGTVALKARFENTDAGLWPGQFVRVTTFMGSDANALLVPLASVQNGQQGTQCFVVGKEDKVELRQVKVLRTTDGQAMIGSGLNEGETVVTDGHLRLEPGSKVVIRSTLHAPAAQAAKP